MKITIAVAMLALVACAQACTIYSLPGAKTASGAAALITASPANAAAYCAARGGSAGQTRSSTLAALGGSAAWNLASGSQDTNGATAVFTGIECVSAAACTTDALGNVGVGNTGLNNFGNGNHGNENVGNNNNGQGNLGDGNNGYGLVGFGMTGFQSSYDIGAILAASPNTIAFSPVATLPAVVAPAPTTAAPAPAPAKAKAVHGAEAPALARKLMFA